MHKTIFQHGLQLICDATLSANFRK